MILCQAWSEVDFHPPLGRFRCHDPAEGCPATMLERVAMGGCVHGPPLPVGSEGRLHDPDMCVDVGLTGLVFDVDEDQGKDLGLGPLDLPIHPLTDRLGFELMEGLLRHGFQDGDRFLDALAVRSRQNLADFGGQGDDEFHGGVDVPLQPRKPGEIFAYLTFCQPGHQAAWDPPMAGWPWIWIGNPAHRFPQILIPEQGQDLAIP